MTLLAELSRESRVAFEEVVREFAGRRFKLIVLSAPGDDELRAALESWVAPGRLAVVDAALAEDNPWEALVAAAAGAAALLTRRLPPAHEDAWFARLNVQRDLFVRDLAIPWVVEVSAEGARKLRDLAPDFADFVSLWLDVPRDTWRTEMPPDLPVWLPEPFGRTDGWPQLVADALVSAERGAIDDARDKLAQARLAGMVEHAVIVEATIERIQGRLDAALERLGGETGEEADRLRRLIRHDRGEEDIEPALTEGARSTLLTAIEHLKAGAEEACERETAIVETDGPLLKAEAGFIRAELLFRRGVSELAHLRAMVADEQLLPIHRAAAQYRLADWLYGAGRFSEARAVLPRLEDLPPELGPRCALTQIWIALNLDGHAAVSALAARLLHRFPEEPLVLEALGRSALRSGDFAEAHLLLERALSAHKPNTPAFYLAKVKVALAQALLMLGELEAAERVSRDARRTFYDTLGEGHPATTSAQKSHVLILGGLGRWAEAESLARSIVQRVAEQKGPRHPAYAELLHEWANALSHLGRYEEAVPLLEESQSITVEAYGLGHREAAMSLTGLAACHRALGDLTAALKEQAAAMAILARASGVGSKPYQHASLERLDMLMDAGNWQESLKALKALHVLPEFETLHRVQTVRALTLAGRWDEALRSAGGHDFQIDELSTSMLNTLLDIAPHRPKQTRPLLQRATQSADAAACSLAWTGLAGVDQKLGDLASAEGSLHRALHTARTAKRADLVQASCFNLANLLQKRGKPEVAVLFYREAAAGPSEPLRQLAAAQLDAAPLAR